VLVHHTKPATGRVDHCRRQEVQRTDELANKQRLRPMVDLSRGADLFDQTAVHHHDAV
jgi:hypothetical protein